VVGAQFGGFHKACQLLFVEAGKKGEQWRPAWSKHDVPSFVLSCCWFGTGATASVVPHTPQRNSQWWFRYNDPPPPAAPSLSAPTPPPLSPPPPLPARVQSDVLYLGCNAIVKVRHPNAKQVGRMHHIPPHHPAFYLQRFPSVKSNNLIRSFLGHGGLLPFHHLFLQFWQALIHSSPLGRPQSVKIVL
jgi:hypothetical protein